MTFYLQMRQGDTQLARYVVELDQAGVTVDRIDLVEPTLDDVFLLKTGADLEEEETGETAAAS